ncbi:unnamed protein product [Pleuronectes platessa]|uniref:Uncharacterized protein n=1 Tax=Pleuronectes platessa TaxID=8262 RepID=A0A9N7V141_PLEPL|nr:unnamed protein product [Pleuronectes platessa]
MQMQGENRREAALIQVLGGETGQVLFGWREDRREEEEEEEEEEKTASGGPGGDTAGRGSRPAAPGHTGGITDPAERGGGGCGRPGPVLLSVRQRTAVSGVDDRLARPRMGRAPSAPQAAVMCPFSLHSPQPARTELSV